MALVMNVLGITTTTTPAPCGLGSGLIGINNQIRSDIFILTSSTGLGLLSPCEETTTATTGETTTTAADETTTVGGLLGQKIVKRLILTRPGADKVKPKVWFKYSL